MGQQRNGGFARLLAASVLLAACSSGPSRGEISWRDLDVTAPDGWAAYEIGDTLLYLADGEAGEEPGDRGTLRAAAQLTYEPGTTPDDWRELVAQEGGTVERDESIEVDGLPATRIVYTWESNAIPTREMVLLVPSRALVVLFQPVPIRGQQDAPEVYLTREAEFEAIVDSIRFGAPVTEPRATADGSHRVGRSSAP